MTLALVLAALLGQTMYEWTDAKGEVHFTDDRSTIPKGVKAKETGGGDLSTIDGEKMPTRAPRKQGNAVDTCAAAKKKVEAAETKLTKAKQQHELALLRWQGNCAEIRSKYGASEETRCLRRGRKSATPPEPTYAPLQAEFDSASETLRRAQVSGCAEAR